METTVRVVVVPEADLKLLLNGQEKILKLLHELQPAHPVPGAVASYITAMEFMQAVRIGRTKFDQLVQTNQVKAIKRDRKIYVPVGEVERYFNQK